jgi:hypothetical protein
VQVIEKTAESLLTLLPGYDALLVRPGNIMGLPALNSSYNLKGGVANPRKFIKLLYIAHESQKCQ